MSEIQALLGQQHGELVECVVCHRPICPPNTIWNSYAPYCECTAKEKQLGARITQLEERLQANRLEKP